MAFRSPDRIRYVTQSACACHSDATSAFCDETIVVFRLYPAVEGCNRTGRYEADEPNQATARQSHRVVVRVAVSRPVLHVHHGIRTVVRQLDPVVTAIMQYPSCAHGPQLFPVQPVGDASPPNDRGDYTLHGCGPTARQD